LDDFPAQVKAQVCHRVKAERKRVGLSQTQLAEALELSDRRHVVKWEHGDWMPGVENLQRLAEVFGRPGYWWFYLPDDEAYAP
jgi:transcriptional regulator with XRE-family HTH domain